MTQQDTATRDVGTKPRTAGDAAQAGGAPQSDGWMRQLWWRLARGANPQEIAQLVTRFPQYRDQVFTLLQRFLGNAYVQQVVAAASRLGRQAVAAGSSAATAVAQS